MNEDIPDFIDDDPTVIEPDKTKPAAYILTHESTGKFYIGSSGNPKGRISRHMSKLRTGVHNSKSLQELHDHDDSFTVAIIPAADKENAFDIEQSLLDRHHGTPYCVNRALDARASARGIVYSQETLEKMRQAKLGKPQKPENIEKARLAKIGLVVSEATREKLSKANLGKVFSEETRLKMSLAKLGKPLSETHRLNMGKARKGMRPSDANIKAISTAVSINSQIFPSMKEAAQKLEISTSTVTWRCKSPKEHFKDWKIL